MQNDYLRDLASSQKIKTAIIVSTLAVVVFFVYFPMLENGFVYDDSSRIQYNLNFRQEHSLIDFIKNPKLSNVESQVAEDTYRPLSTYFLYLQYRIFGQEAFGYHVVSLILHICNAILVFFLFQLLFRKARYAFFGALIFALHPVTTETVAWAFQQSGLWSWMFFLLTLFFGLFLSDSRKWLKLVVLFLTSLLSVFFKEQAVILVGAYFLIMLLKDFLNSSQSFDPKGLVQILKKRYLELFAVFLPTLIYFLARAKFLGQIGQSVKLALWPHIAGIIVESLARYFKLLIWPHPLLVNHDDLLRLLDWQSTDFIASVVILIVLIFFIMFFRKRQLLISVGLIWVFLILLPVSNIFFQTKQAMNERFLYLGVIGWIFVIIGFINIIIKKFGETKIGTQIVINALLIVLAIYAVLDRGRLKVWNNNLSLWTHEIKYSPKSARAQLYYAAALEENNRSAEAAQYYLNAIPYASVPKSFFVFRAGIAYLHANDLEQAGRIAQEGKEEFPDQSVFWELSGRVRIEQGKYKNAEEDFLRIREMNKGVDKPLAFYIILARVLQQQKEPEVFKGFEKFLTTNEQRAYYSSMLGKKHLSEKDFESARDNLIQGLAISAIPMKDPYIWLAQTAENLGDLFNAQKVYELMDQLFPGNLESKQGLARLKNIKK